MQRMALVLVLLLFGSFTPTPKKSTIKIVIDAGHGGSDPGHLPHSKKYKSEKEINLQVALFLGEYIKKYLGNVEVMYTRTDDTFPSLDERVDLANNNNIDYFISIHCNGNPKKHVYGTESHVHNYSAKKSYSFALEIENQFASRAGRTSRGVKNNDDRAHSIQVLKFTKMTSVLVECGFMTNDKEAHYLNSTQGQEIIASAIFRAFRTRAKFDFPEISLEKSTIILGEHSIQIMSSKEPIDPKDRCFKKLEGIVKRIELNTKNAYKYKYQVGPFKTQNEAKSSLTKVQKAGFPDAIIVRN
jgi:N-acetylmuramoyl-L-alanine amidase